MTRLPGELNYNGIQVDVVKIEPVFCGVFRKQKRTGWKLTLSCGHTINVVQWIGSAAAPTVACGKCWKEKKEKP